MTHLIRVGGLAVILAVFGIFFFILKEIVPLFSKAEVVAEAVTQTKTAPKVIGVDEWGQRPFLYTGGDEIVVLSGETGERESIPVPSLAEVEVTAVSYDPVNQRVTLGLADGRVGSFLVEYESVFREGQPREVAVSVVEEPWYELETGDGPVRSVSYGDGGAKRLISVVRETGVAVVQLVQKRSLIGKGKLTRVGETDLSAQIPAEVISTAASQNGQAVLISTAAGKVHYFKMDEGELGEVQQFEPFDGKPARRMDYLFGGVSVAMTDEAGQQRVYSLFRPEGSNTRLFGQTKEFAPVGEGVPVFASSLRNKSFLCGAGGNLAVRHLTSGATRWEGKAEFEPVAVTIDGKVENFFLAGPEGQVQRFSLHDPHPESGWRAFFGKVWYEGGSEPVHQWQSTGGSDDFEPKLSLVPLIIGSLKGTFYALLFSVPIALLAAVFSAAFLPPAMKRIVKPSMEIMASLPS
ncbi:MAG: hypothetical protein ACPG4K_03280, partial [Haloferula sp.]